MMQMFCDKEVVTRDNKTFLVEISDSDSVNSLGLKDGDHVYMIKKSHLDEMFNCKQLFFR